MGAGFWIIQRTIKSAAEKVREDEKREAKLRADGYVRKFGLMNPNTCYVHYYRKYKTQQRGVIYTCLTMLAISILIPLMVILPFTIWFLIPIIAIVTFLSIGLLKIFNSDIGWSATKEPIVREGCFCFKTEHEPLYDYKWIKEEEK